MAVMVHGGDRPVVETFMAALAVRRILLVTPTPRRRRTLDA